MKDDLVVADSLILECVLMSNCHTWMPYQAPISNRGQVRAASNDSGIYQMAATSVGSFNGVLIV
jgi:hypothetical protein